PQKPWALHRAVRAHIARRRLVAPKAQDRPQRPMPAFAPALGARRRAQTSGDYQRFAELRYTTINRPMSCPDENTLVAFSERRLSDGEVVAVEAHLDICPPCRKSISAWAHSRTAPPTHPAPPDLEGLGDPLASLHRGSPIERYIVIERLGVGGMGVVYA